MNYSRTKRDQIIDDFFDTLIWFGTLVFLTLPLLFFVLLFAYIFEGFNDYILRGIITFPILSLLSLLLLYSKSFYESIRRKK